MKKLLSLLFTCITLLGYAQEGNQSLNCPIVISRPCGGSNSFTIPTYYIDDIKAITSIGSTYQVKNITDRRGCRPYIDPGAVADSVLDPIDDQFSKTIGITFPFVFYGVSYDSLVVTTNGYLSFDKSLKGAYATWNLTPGDLPNTSYCGAMIAGPFHDLDPRPSANPPADMKVFYSVVGVAPNRKFIVTYSKVPLYSASCNSMINTHQIVLHESTGVIDVFIKEKRICTGWNSGKAMVGIQNIRKTNGLMAPGRFATSPSWSILPTNPTEVWRFVPNSVSTSLYQQIEIVDTSGNIIYSTNQSPSSTPLVPYSASADTVRADESTLKINFPSIPFPPNFVFSDTNYYLIKTKYIDPNNPLGYNYDVDTMYVIKDSIRINAIDTSSASCIGNDGKIRTINFTGGAAPFSYSLNGGVTFNALSIPVPSPLADTLITNQPYHLIIKDNTGCRSLDTLLLIGLDDNMNLRPIADVTVCAETANTFSAVLNPQAVSNTSFLWSAIPASPALLSTIRTPTANNTIIIPTDTATYTLNANWAYCNRKDTFNINVKHKPQPDAGQDLRVCNYKRDTILTGRNLDSSGTINYSWSPASTLSTPNNAITSANPDSTQLYILTVTDNYGCSFSVSDSMYVIVKKRVAAFAGNDTIAMTGGEHRLLGSGGYRYVWSPARFFKNIGDSTKVNPIVVLNNDQMFVVTVTDADGCIGKDSVFVKVYPGPDYNTPTAFSPNGDGLNDIFRVVPSGIEYTEWFKIYNRYGELVFQTNRWMKGWDGRRNGKLQPPGTYIWMIKGTDRYGKAIEKKGSFLLIN